MQCLMGREDNISIRIFPFCINSPPQIALGGTSYYSKGISLILNSTESLETKHNGVQEIQMNDG